MGKSQLGSTGPGGQYLWTFKVHWFEFTQSDWSFQHARYLRQ